MNGVKKGNRKEMKNIINFINLQRELSRMTAQEFNKNKNQIATKFQEIMETSLIRRENNGK